MFDINVKPNDFMSIVVTHECNKQCPFCIDKYRGNTEYITIRDVKKALVIAKENSIKDILLVGGEPTLHDNILEISKLIHKAGFKTIMTTNYSKPEIVKKLDKYIDSFNISYYNQDTLPDQNDFTADLTISALIYKGQLDTKQKLDNFIDMYSKRFNLKFSTLTVCNDWTKVHENVPYLDSLDGETVILFDEVMGTIYHNYVIKRANKIINKNANQSLKCHVNGDITRTWERNINKK